MPESHPKFVNLSDAPSAARLFVSELRDRHVQKDSMRFRMNLQRIAEILAYEISKTLDYEPVKTESVLGFADELKLKSQPVLVTVMRAALPFHTGFLNVFDHAENGFIGAARGPHKADLTFDIQMDYLAAPKLEGKTVLLIDPMLATGKSLIRCWQTLTATHGIPARLYIASAIASRAGVAHIRETLPEARIYTAAMDPDLDENFYIVPGLGDAGDLAFGEKLSVR